MKLEFVIAKPEDAKIVAKLAEIIWKEHYTPIIGEEQVEYMLATLQSPEVIEKAVAKGEMCYYIIRQDNENVGYAGISTDKDKLFLSKLYILKSVRGKGIARKALDYIEELAREKQINKIWLTCNVNNQDTLDKYKSLGFNYVDSVKNHIGQGYYMDDYILEKIL